MAAKKDKRKLKTNLFDLKKLMKEIKRLKS